MAKHAATKVPQIRFKGFEREWEKEPLLSRVTKITDFRGRTPKKLGLDWSPSGYMALSALNVKDGYIDRNADAHYGDEELYTKWMRGSELHCNQVLFTTEAPMGNVAQIPDDQKYILSQRTIAFVTDTTRLSEDYLAILLKSPNVFGELLARSSGGTAKGVSQKSLSSVDVCVTNELAEQSKIGSYFRRLDRLIGLHQLKHEKLVTLKKALLKKMFPEPGATSPVIRFKGFSGAWKVEPVSSLLSERNIQAPKSDQYPLMAFIAGQGVAPKGERYNREFLVSDEVNKKYKQTEFGDFIYSSNNLETGSIGLNKFGRASISPVYSIFSPTQNGDSEFIGQLLCQQSFIGEMVKWRQGVVYGQWRIHESDFLSIETTFPLVEEQKKIGAYFSALDNLISSHATQLLKLKQIKSACLEKMFV